MTYLPTPSLLVCLLVWSVIALVLSLMHRGHGDEAPGGIGRHPDP